jgi:hypothetical protein
MTPVEHARVYTTAFIFRLPQAAGRAMRHYGGEGSEISEGKWLTTLDDFRNWLRLGLTARESE